MLSKGKKIIYSCPNCKSENIHKQIYKPGFKFIGTNTGNCDDCNSWWSWSSRIKTPVRKLEEKNKMKKPIRVSRGHMGDLEAAALNCGNKKLQERFEEMKKDPGFEIVDNPKPDEFLQDLSIMFMYPSPPPTIPNLNVPKLTTVQDVIDKAMVFDPALENADPAILTHREVPFAELSDQDLEDMYQFNYPQNVKWLIEIRKDFIEKHHPNELV